MILGKINDRQILYIDTNGDSNWPTLVPSNNWVVFVIADNPQIPELDYLAKVCLDNKCLYICGAGEAASRIDDIFDIEIVNRKLSEGDDNYDDTPITMWHDDFDEGFWFAATLAYHESEDVDKVVCINMTQQALKNKISELIGKINMGWLPED